MLQRYIEGLSTKEENELVGDWLNADEKHMQEFLLLRNAYDALVWSENKALDQPEHDNQLSKPSKRIRIIREFGKIAAIFLIALGCFHLFSSDGIEMQDKDIVLQKVYTPEGQRSEVTLADGTRVWLNAQSSLTFPNKFDKERIVELDGEAYFDVTHDDEKKFIVKTKNYQVMVHGTEFNVVAYSENDHFETALIEGSVEVVSNATNENLFLLPNSKVYVENNKFEVLDLHSLDQFLWKKGILSFENENVEDLFEKLELYYGVEFNITNRNILRYQYTGKFWVRDGVEHVLKVLQLRHNFKYSIDNMNKITIS